MKEGWVNKKKRIAQKMRRKDFFCDNVEHDVNQKKNLLLGDIRELCLSTHVASDGDVTNLFDFSLGMLFHKTHTGEAYRKPTKIKVPGSER